MLETVKFDENTPERSIALLSECIEKTQGIEKSEAMLNEFCQKNVLDKHKKVARAELIRVRFQEKLNKSGGVLSAKDLQEAFGAQKPEEKEEQA